MLDWWNSLSIAAQVFACIAVPSTVVLLIQTVLMLIGIGHDGDGGDMFHLGEGDISDSDVGIDAEFDADVSDGVFGHDGVIADNDISGFDGLRVFTIRGIIAFLVVFGWVGVVLDKSGAELWISSLIATVSGFAIMIALAFLMRWVMKLRDNGNADNHNALGVAGKVYLTIPPKRSGEGKVNIMLQGAYVERDAVTDEEQAIPTGSEIVVTSLSGQTTLVVKRK